ncbi:MAG: tetratricopeptide repeat protein [Bacteroidales bacterium]|nr:tetratricopeptide repeat protein [Bacteroidales bacterium]
MKIFSFYNIYFFRIPILLFFISIYINSYSQRDEINLLKQQLIRVKSDTSRINLLNDLAYSYLESNLLEEGNKRSIEALYLAEKIDYKIGKAQALENMGLYNEYNNQYRKAIDYYKLSYDVCQELNDNREMARQLNNIGAMHRTMASYDTALNYFQKSLELLKKVNDSSILAQTCSLIGLVYSSKGNFEGSLEFLVESLYLYECTNDDLGMGIAYCNIGMIYRRLQDYEKALEFQLKAIELDEKSEAQRPIIESYIQIGIIYEETAKYKKAIETYQKGLAIAKKYNDKKKIAGCLNNIGVVYFDIKDFHEALEYYFQSLDIKKQIGDKHGITVTAINIAEAYFELLKSNKISHQEGEINFFESSDNIIALLEESVILAEETGNYQDLSNTYNALIGALSYFSEYERAVHYQAKLIALNDSLFTIEKNSKLANLQTQFSTQQKKQEIALLNTINSTQETRLNRQNFEKYFYMGGGIALMILVFGLLSRLNFIRRTRNELRLKSKQIENEKKRAEKSQKVKDQFLANMSHEIRTPMNSLIGMTSILQKNKHLKSQEKYLDAINKSSENLLVVINDILDFSSLETGKIKFENTLFKLEDEIQKVEDILKYRAKEKRIKLECIIEEGLPEWIIGDPTRLSQVLLNLAGNAIKFTDNGIVTGLARLKEKKNSIAIIEFEVKDTGIGIPEDRLETIFESFTQAYSETSRQYGGTGLGLAISKQLVELQNGTITVESKFGHGSIFRFSIPYEIGHSVNTKKEKVKECDQALNGLHVLVVEDNDFNVMVASEELRSLIKNINVDVAENGRIAVEKVTTNNYDLILMDIEMPEMNGYESTRIIRNLGPPRNIVPIIAMTANTMKGEAKKCHEAGMNEYMAKPFKPEDLAAKIHELICVEKAEVE